MKFEKKKFFTWKQKIAILFKGYLRYKTILCHKAALDVYFMIFFIWRKNKVSFLRYRDFCVFVKPADFKIFDVIISIGASYKLHLCLFLLKPKSYQNEIWSNTSAVLQTFLICFWVNAEDWKLVPGFFMILLKWWHRKIWLFFNGWHITFLVVLYSPFTFQKNETLEY